MSTKKGSAKPKTTKTKTTAPVVTVSSEEEATQVEEMTASNTVTQVVTDWSTESALESVGDSATVQTPTPTPTQTTTEKKSVLDFDRTEVAKYENQLLSTLTIDQRLMALIRLGEEQKNPVISGGCERLLRQINREPFQSPHKSGGHQNNRDRGQQFRGPRPPTSSPTTPHFANPSLPDDQYQRGGGRNGSQFRIPRESRESDVSKDYQPRESRERGRGRGNDFSRGDYQQQHGSGRGGPPRGGDRPVYTRGPRPDVNNQNL